MQYPGEAHAKLVCSYVVVEGDLEQPPTNGNLFVFDHYDVDAEYRTLEDGGVDPGLPFIFISPATHKDPDHPGLCPPGHTNFQVKTLAPARYGPWGVEAGPASGARYRRVGGYRDMKAWYESRMLDAAERALGPFRDRIVHVETATPLTQERYTWSTQGTSYGLRHSPDQTGPFRPQHRIEIRGLFLAGANTATGHGIVGTLSGGARCASEIVDRDLLGEMLAGHQLVDPDLIRPVEADRDPLEVSRGLALRARRNRTTADVS